MDRNTKSKSSFTIFIVSGGAGASGEQLVHTILSQFPDSDVEVIIVANVRQEAQIEEVLFQAKREQGLVVHTLVESRLRAYLIERARQEEVAAIDLVGELLARLSQSLGRQPLERPGLYRLLRRDYFERVAAIEFAMAHDDGKNPQDWHQADILLLGVSRVGKTPLSLYLSVLGLKVANCPVIPELPLPAELARIERHRVIALTIEPGQLVQHRLRRQSHLGAPGYSAYADPQKVYEEVQASLEIYHRYGFTILDVTDKPIETSADEVIRLTQELPRKAKGI